jgi:hypothetical protein
MLCPQVGTHPFLLYFRKVSKAMHPIMRRGGWHLAAVELLLNPDFLLQLEATSPRLKWTLLMDEFQEIGRLEDRPVKGKV